MKSLKIALIALGLTSIGSAFAGADCQAYPQNERIPEQAFKTALQKEGFKIKEFKVSGNCYEMYAKSPKGRKVEMYFDMKTGKIVKQEIDD